MPLTPFLLTAILVRTVLRIRFKLIPLPGSLFGVLAFLPPAACLILMTRTSFKQITTVDTLDLILEWLYLNGFIHEVEKSDELYGLVTQASMN